MRSPAYLVWLGRNAPDSRIARGARCAIALPLRQFRWRAQASIRLVAAAQFGDGSIPHYREGDHVVEQRHGVVVIHRDGMIHQPPPIRCQQFHFVQAREVMHQLIPDIAKAAYRVESILLGMGVLRATLLDRARWVTLGTWEIVWIERHAEFAPHGKIVTVPAVPHSVESFPAARRASCKRTACHADETGSRSPIVDLCRKRDFAAQLVSVEQYKKPLLGNIESLLTPRSPSAQPLP